MPIEAPPSAIHLRASARSRPSAIAAAVTSDG